MVARWPVNNFIFSGIILAMGEPLRARRYFNLLLALILVIGVWILPGVNLLAQINGIVVALVIAVLSIPRGPKTETYGRWDRIVA